MCYIVPECNNRDAITCRNLARAGYCTVWIYQYAYLLHQKLMHGCDVILVIFKVNLENVQFYFKYNILGS